MSELIKVGTYKQEYNNILGLDMPILDIYKSSGLYKHIKKKHKKYIDYMNCIDDILNMPDYVGINPNEPNSIELVKSFNDNIQIAIKLNSDSDYYYIATLHEIEQQKIDRRLNGGRLKKYQ